MDNKQNHTAPAQTNIDSVWQVVPNPDHPNTLADSKSCTCSPTFAVQHKDGGLIRFYMGQTMDRQTAHKLKRELELQEK